MTYATIAEVRAANAAAGFHWFEPDTIRFFRSKIGGRVYGGRYFISSEQYHDRCSEGYCRRKYTVREACENGDVSTVGEFQGYDTFESARTAIRELLKAEADGLAAIRELLKGSTS